MKELDVYRITDEQFNEMRSKAGVGKCDMPEPVIVPLRKWYQGWKVGANIGMMSRWTGKQGKKDMKTPFWEKIYGRIFITRKH